MSTVILGLGNPLRADDGVGLHVARALEARLHGRTDVCVRTLGDGGLAAAEVLVEHARAIVVDARLGPGCPGQWEALPLQDAVTLRHAAGPHDASLPLGLKVLEALGARVPAQVTVVGVTAGDLDSFSESLTPGVARAVPEVVQHVLSMLDIGGVP